MKRESIYYTVIGAGILVILAVVMWQFWPAANKPLDPPEVVAQRLDSSPTKEGKVQAAQDLVRHGPAAREQIRAAISHYEDYEPEVVAPLAQAAMKSEDYQSLPVLLRMMEDEDANVRGRAGAAVQRIMGADYGFRANMPADERARIIAQIQSEIVLFRDRFPEVYPQR